MRSGSAGQRRVLTSTSLLCVGLAIATTACSGSDFAPPPRSATVRAEEVRLATLIERSQRAGFSSGPGHCDVRVLGISGATSYAWADCSFTPEPGIDSGVSTAFRVDGTKVTSPRDGSEFSDSIRSMFPAQMAEAILKHSDDLRPSPSPTP